MNVVDIDYNSLFGVYLEVHKRKQQSIFFCWGFGLVSSQVYQQPLCLAAHTALGARLVMHRDKPCKHRHQRHSTIDLSKLLLKGQILQALGNLFTPLVNF